MTIVIMKGPQNLIMKALWQNDLPNFIIALDGTVMQDTLY